MPGAADKTDKGNVKATRLWTKDFIFVILAKTFSSTTFGLYNTCIPSYVVYYYGSNVGLAGMGVTIFLISVIIARFIAGKYTTAIGSKRMLVIGSVITALFTLPYFIKMGVLWFLVLRFIHGFAFGVANNTLTVVAVDYIPEGRLGEGLGFFSLSTTLATALGPYLGITLLRMENYSAMFLVVTIAAFLSLFFSIPLTSIRHEVEAPAPGEKKRGFLENYVEFSALPLSILITIVTLGYASANSLVNLFANERGLEAVSFFFAVYAVVLLVARPTAGTLLDKRGPRVVAYPSLICLVLAFLSLVFCHNNFLLLLSSALFALGFGCSFSTVQTLIIQDATPERVPVATSTFYVFTDIGMGLGPSLLGLLVEPLGFTGLFLVDMGIALLAIPVLALLLRKRDKAKQV